MYILIIHSFEVSTAYLFKYVPHLCTTAVFHSSVSLRIIVSNIKTQVYFLIILMTLGNSCLVVEPIFFLFIIFMLHEYRSKTIIYSHNNLGTEDTRDTPHDAIESDTKIGIKYI